MLTCVKATAKEPWNFCAESAKYVNFGPWHQAIWVKREREETSFEENYISDSW